MGSIRDIYMAKSGQSAVMAEFLVRGFNAAVPEADVGDDLFVVEDETGRMSRIQVKTSTAKPLKSEDAYSAQFWIPLKQLAKPKRPELCYVLVVRVENGWEFLVISRADLYREHKLHGVGSPYQGRLYLKLTFREDRVDGFRRNFQQYRNNWPPSAVCACPSRTSG